MPSRLGGKRNTYGHAATQHPSNERPASARLLYKGGHSAGHRLLGPCNNRPVGYGSVYCAPQEAEQDGSKGWDKVLGTTEEFVEHWLSFVLELWPDKLNITQRLIEGWRDAAMAHAV